MGVSVRHERPSWFMAGLAAVLLLSSSLAASPASADARLATASRPAERSVRVVVDGVSLVVRSPAIPGGFVGSRPGEPLQGAVAVSERPYREFSIRAYPFGSLAPMEGLGIVEPGHLRAYRAVGAGNLIPVLEPSASIFGQNIEGSVRVVGIGLGPRYQRTEVASFLADGGGRLWIVRAAGPLPAGLAAEREFADGTFVSAANLQRPTTVPRTEFASRRAAFSAGKDAIAVPANAADPPPVPTPAWWSGNCDVNNDPQSFELSSWDGLAACGPGPNQGGQDEPVAFFGGAWPELEWECVELSMRWLYLEYGVRPYPANGSQVVANYSRADGGDLEKIANDGSTVPLPGDVLSMEPTSVEGHTAVVTASNVTAGNGTISVLQENMPGGKSTDNLRVVRNVVQPDYGMPVTEWLQAPGRSAPSGTSSTTTGDLVQGGGFNFGDGGGWNVTRASHFAVHAASKKGTQPYEGNGFGATSTPVVGGGIYQNVAIPVSSGESFCADAEVVTDAAAPGARGNMTVWLLGGTARQWSTVNFGPLPADSQWTHVSTCVTATRPHSYVRIQFYDAPHTPVLGIDAVDLR